MFKNTLFGQSGSQRTHFVEVPTINQQVEDIKNGAKSSAVSSSVSGVLNQASVGLPVAGQLAAFNPISQNPVGQFASTASLSTAPKAVLTTIPTFKP